MDSRLAAHLGGSAKIPLTAFYCIGRVSHRCIGSARTGSSPTRSASATCLSSIYARHLPATKSGRGEVAADGGQFARVPTTPVIDSMPAAADRWMAPDDLQRGVVKRV